MTDLRNRRVATWPVPPSLAIYGSWLITCVLGVGVMIVWRAVFLQLYIWLGLDKWAFAAFNNGVVIALVITWLALVIGTEAWYRDAQNPATLRRRAGRVLGILVVLLGVGYLVERIV